MCAAQGRLKSALRLRVRVSALRFLAHWATRRRREQEGARAPSDFSARRALPENSQAACCRKRENDLPTATQYSIQARLAARNPFSIGLVAVARRVTIYRNYHLSRRAHPASLCA